MALKMAHCEVHGVSVVALDGRIVLTSRVRAPRADLFLIRVNVGHEHAGRKSIDSRRRQRPRWL